MFLNLLTHKVSDTPSYASLAEAKWKVVNEIETRLALQPFSNEWELSKSGDRQDFSKIEGWIPWVFGLLWGCQKLCV